MLGRVGPLAKQEDRELWAVRMVMLWNAAVTAPFMPGPAGCSRIERIAASMVRALGVSACRFSPGEIFLLE